MNKFWKKLKYKLEFYDGIWSIPLAFLAFFLGGKYSFKYFGDALISTEYIQYGLLSSLIMIFMNFVVLLGARFNFKSLQNYFYSKEVKEDVAKNLSTWQRLRLYLFVYFGLSFLFILILFLVMIMTA
jgi:hypothetical protein